MRNNKAAVLALMSTGLVCALISSSTHAQRPAAISWVFDTKDDSSGNPHGKVFLVVAGHSAMINSHADSHYQTLARRDYQAHAVPSHAITACFGWWAGQGEELYVTRHQQILTVYARELDESTPLGKYHHLRTIRLHK